MLHFQIKSHQDEHHLPYLKRGFFFSPKVLKSTIQKTKKQKQKQNNQTNRQKTSPNKRINKMNRDNVFCRFIENSGKLRKLIHAEKIVLKVNVHEVSVTCSILF